MAPPIAGHARKRAHSASDARAANNPANSAAIMTTSPGRIMAAQPAHAPQYTSARRNSRARHQRSKKYSAATVANSTDVCCHNAWLAIDHVAVAIAYTNVSIHAHRSPVSRFNNASIASADEAAIAEAANFSAILANATNAPGSQSRNRGISSSGVYIGVTKTPFQIG